MHEVAAVIQSAWQGQGEEISLEARSRSDAGDWEAEAWDSFAWQLSSQFADGLRSIGLPASEVTVGSQILLESKTEYDAALKDLWTRGANYHQYITAPEELQRQADQLLRSSQSSVFTKLRNWWSGRTIVVDKRELIDVRIPLFVLAAPATPGSAAEYESTAEHESQLGWTVKLLGTGIAGSATIVSSVSSTLGASSGQACLVFLPVTAAAEVVRVVDSGGKTLGQGARLDLSPNIEASPVPGALLLAPSAIPKAGPLLQSYALDGYAGPPAEYTYKYSQQGAVSIDLGVKAFDVELSLKGASTMQGTVAVTFKLAGGVNYALHHSDTGDGVVWQ